MSENKSRQGKLNWRELTGNREKPPQPLASPGKEVICKYCFGSRATQVHDAAFVNRSEFQKRAQGCAGCLLVLQAIEQSEKRLDLRAGTIVRVQIWHPDGLKGASSILLHELDKTRSGTQHLLSCGCDAGSSEFGVYKITREFTWQRRQSQAQAWIDECASNHIHCQRAGSTPLPRRVLDVGHREAFLVETKGASGQYVTLSHCWHDSQPLTTSRSTLQSRLGRLFWNELPIAFQESIELVRLMGIRFLWIDSLCICQDDPEEWDIEAARMASIYENSYLTINMHQPGPNQSCLINDNVFSLSFRPSRLNTTTINFRLHDQFVGRHNIETDHLASRGWCFQERLLSNRILHCTPYEVMLECAESRKCGCSPWLEHQGDFWSNHFSQLNWKSIFAKNSITSDQWRQMITLYSQKELTFAKDVLPALSSIANRCRGLGKYYAGMWESDFPKSLLWYGTVRSSMGKDILPQRHNEYLSPSFAWSSTSGPKAFLKIEIQKPSELVNAMTTLNVDGQVVTSQIPPMVQEFKVVEISCQPQGHNPLGNLKSGSHMVVNGCCLSARFVHTFERPMSSSVFIRHGMQDERCLWATLKLDMNNEHYIFHPDYPIDENEVESLLCLQLFATVVPGNQLCYGLVLGMMNGQEHWTRIGLIASMDADLWHNAQLEAFWIY